MITGKEDKSFSVDEIKESKDINFGATKIMFAHEAVKGEKGIDLNNLNDPAEMMANGFPQASPAELASAHLSIFRKNLTLKTSGGSVLTQYLDFVVTDAGTINFLGTLGEIGAQDGEIFIGEVELATANALVVADVKITDLTLSVPADLAIGTKIISVGNEYEVNKNFNSQTGSIKPYLNGKRIYRNKNNVAADPLADGNYHEIDSGNGFGTTIELNKALADKDIIGFDFGLTIGQGDQQLFGTMEFMQGIMLKLAQDSALNFFGEGDALRYLSNSPTELERRLFGDNVFTLNTLVATILNTEIPYIGPWSAYETIVLNAVTTVPTKGNIATDRVRWRQVGEDYEVEYQFEQTNPGTVGNGEYAIQLPAGVLFHSTQYFKVGIIGNAFSDSDQPALVGGGHIGDGVTGGDGHVFAASVSNFAVTWKSQNSGAYLAWSHTYYDFASSFGFNIKLKFKGEGLSRTKKLSELI